MQIWKFFLQLTVYLNTRISFRNLHVCSNGLGKMWLSYTYHFSTRLLTSTHAKEFNIFFRIIYVAMSKMWRSYTYHFSTRLLTSTHAKEFNIFFRIIYVAMSNNQFLFLDMVKMTCQTHMF